MVIRSRKTKRYVPVDDLKSCLQDTQELAELAAVIGGDLEEEISVLDRMEDKITSFMNTHVPQVAELLKKAHILYLQRKEFLILPKQQEKIRRY